MIIKDAIELIRSSILRNQVKVGEDSTALLGFINMGVLELHKRFRLAFGEAVITTAPGKYVYRLDGIDADVSIDLAGFEVLAIEQLLDDEYEPVGLNVSVDPKSSKILSYNTIKIGQLEESPSFTVIYRTSPEFSILASETIPLSSVFFDALFHYVGYQAFLSVNGEENTQHNLHKKRFEDSVQRISSLGLYQQNDLKTDKLAERTFI